MKILSGNRIDRTEWSELVQTSTTGAWFQTLEAYDSFASMPELFKPFSIAVSNSNSVLRGVCCGCVIRERNSIKQYFTRRAIIIGGPCLADDATDEEVIKLLWAIRNDVMSATMSLNDGLMRPIYIETRNFNDYSWRKAAFAKAGFAYQQHLNFHVDCTSLESLKENLSDNRKRQISKSNSVANMASDESEIKEWYQVLKELYRTKVKTPLFPLSFFIQAYRQKVAKYMLVKHNGKVIGGSMLVQDKKSVYEWFDCGLDKKYRDQYPSVAVTYAGMKCATDSGILRYDGYRQTGSAMRRAGFQGRVRRHSGCTWQMVIYRETNIIQNRMYRG